MTMRMSNALLYNDIETLGIANPGLATEGGLRGNGISNLIDSGPLGIGAHIPQLDGFTPLVFNPTYIVVTHTPRIWDHPKYVYNKAIFKALMERCAKSVSGIDVSYTLNTGEAPASLDGQQLPVPLNTVRNQITPNFTWTEVAGNLIWNFFRRWIFDIQHPDTHASLISSVLSEGGKLADIPDWVVSAYSASFVAIQFDPTMMYDKIIDCVFYTSVFPTETGELGLERQIGSAKLMDRSIPFRCMWQHNDNTKALGMVIAKALQMHKPNYNKSTTASGISLDLREYGVHGEIMDTVKEFLDQTKGDFSENPAFKMNTGEYTSGSSSDAAGYGKTSIAGLQADKQKSSGTLS